MLNHILRSTCLHFKINIFILHGDDYETLKPDTNSTIS